MKLLASLCISSLVASVTAGGFGAPLAFAAPSKIPSVDIFDATFPGPKTVNVAEYCAGKNVIIVGLPGAFTPT